MTDARLPERYLVDRRVVRLSAEDRSGYFMSLLWSVSNRTDGQVEPDDLAFIPTFKASVTALVAAGLWLPAGEGNGWVIADFKTTQTGRHELEILENARRRDRTKKARQRAERASEIPPSSPSVPRAVPGDVSPGQHRRGEERTGQDYEQDQQQPDWPTRQPGAGDDGWFVNADGDLQERAAS